MDKGKACSDGRLRRKPHTRALTKLSQLMPSEQLTVNVAQVVHETIDGETILIHLGSGAYYSLAGCGADVWELLAAGAGVEEVLASTQTRYEAEPEHVAQPVRALLDELLAEELILRSTSDAPARAQPGEDGSQKAPQAANADESEPAARVPFVAPVLHKYTDMQQFMLVDPLHDVEQDVGWPHLKDG
jgi:Coenzyme PQQ synthesis protein D (PqqD)